MTDLTDEQIRAGFEVDYENIIHAVLGRSQRALEVERAYFDGARFAEREMKAQLKRMEMLRQGHRRLEVRYWTGHWWEPLTGASLDACLDALGDTGASTKDL